MAKEHPEYKTDMTAQESSKQKEKAKFARKAAEDDRKDSNEYKIFHALALALDHENADLVATKAMDIFERDKQGEGKDLTDYSEESPEKEDDRDETEDPTSDDNSSLTDDGSYTPGDKRGTPEDQDTAFKG